MATAVWRKKEGEEGFWSKTSNLLSNQKKKKKKRRKIAVRGLYKRGFVSWLYGQGDLSSKREMERVQDIPPFITNGVSGRTNGSMDF